MFINFFNLFFPRTCLCCERLLISTENQICTTCFYHLSLTNFVNLVNNPVEKIFWGRAKIEAATAFLYFQKKENTQKILHEIKYNGNIKLAKFMGNQIGIELKNSNRFEDIDIIIPIPLHPKKKKKRGYNQSEEIAKGIIKHFPREIITNCLIRTNNTETQTKKKRISRWVNVVDKFEIINTETIKGKHILLIDDVITTGATLDACAQTLLSVPNVKVSIATLAYAGD